MDNSEYLGGSSPSLVLRESVQPIQHCLDVLPLQKFLYKLDCAALSKSKPSVKTDSLDRRCLSPSVTRPSMEIISTRILTTISSISGVGGTLV